MELEDVAHVSGNHDYVLFGNKLPGLLITIKTLLTNYGIPKYNRFEVPTNSSFILVLYINYKIVCP